MSNFTERDIATLQAITAGLSQDRWNPATMRWLATVIDKVLVSENAVPTPEGRKLLTEDEHKALKLSGELANLCFKIIRDGGGATRTTDAEEMAVRVHSIQHAIMAQAAARAYPDKYRLLGSVIKP